MAAIYEDDVPGDVPLLGTTRRFLRGGDGTEQPRRRPLLDRWAVLALSLLSYSGLGFGDTFGLYSVRPIEYRPGPQQQHNTRRS